MNIKKNKMAELKLSQIIIGLGLLVFLILLISGLVMIGNHTKKNKQDINLEPVTFYIRALDSDTNKQVDVEYIITDELDQIIRQGDLNKNSLVQIPNIPRLEKFNIYCGYKGYYLTKQIKTLNELEKQSNSSKIECKTNKIGDLQITHSGELGGTKAIILNISSTNHFNKISAVLTWASGIINVEFTPEELFCNEWKVYPYLLDKKGVPIITGDYTCEGVRHTCSELKEIKENRIVIERRCVLPEEKIPARFYRKVDKAIFTGKSINKNTYELILYPKTIENMISSDFLEITIYDKDLIHDGTGFVFKSEHLGENVGAEDFTIKIPYLK